jgi:hypothetical protein
MIRTLNQINMNSMHKEQERILTLIDTERIYDTTETC